MPPITTQVNLAKSKYQIESPELPQELESRLRREEADATHKRDEEREESAHRRARERVILYAVVATVCVAALVSAGLSIWPIGSESAKWANTMLTTIVSAGVGYMMGKSNK